jgi:uncharacterized DUF497 family protein
MNFEWDEAKRAKVVAERSIDFLRLANLLFDGRPLLTMISPRGEEQRFVSVGMVENVFYAVIWTSREDVTRLITARRARDGEIRQYRALHH